MSSCYTILSTIYFILCPIISEAERRLKELEEERQKLDKELQRAQGKINITEKCMTELQSTILKVMTFSKRSIFRLRKHPDSCSRLRHSKHRISSKNSLAPSSCINSIEIQFHMNVKYCVF